VDQDKNKDRKVSVLLKSSKQSWLRNTPDIQPDTQKYPEMGFPVEGERGSHPLAVAIQGTFQSYFKGKPSPLSQSQSPAPGSQGQPAPTPGPQTASMVESSPDTARLIVVGSGDFLNDIVFQISASMSQDRYLNSLQFIQNAVDWSVEDLDLLSIRSRGTSARVLAPMSKGQESFWEGLNYGLALLGLVALGLVWNWRKRNERPMALEAPSRESISPAGSEA
jgi:ABC-2 type transport system permease protein